MKGNKIRNIVVLGHQGSGKTTLVEALYSTVSGKQKGSIEKGTTISEEMAEANLKLSSISLSVVHMEYEE